MSFAAGAVIGKIILDATQWTAGQSQVQKEQALLANGMRKLSLASVALSAGIVDGFVAITKASYNFEKAFANVTTVVDTSVVDVGKMKTELLGLDSRLGSAADLTNGLYQALSASVDPAKAVQFVSDAAIFAKAALVDTNTAVDVITTGLNAYGLAAENAGAVSDIFFKTIMVGKTTGQELSAVIGTSIPLASNMGVSLEELGASIAIMTQQGIKSAQATTQFNSAVNAFIKPTAEMKKIITKLGFESGTAAIKQLGLKGAIDAVKQSTNGSSTALAAAFNNIEAYNGVLALTGKGAANFAGVLDYMKTKGDATGEAFAKQEITFETLGNSVNKAMIILGQSFLPVVEDVVESITKAVQWVADWDEGTKRLVLTVAGITAVAIPVVAVLISMWKAYTILKPIILAIQAGFAFQAAAAGSSTIAIAANTMATKLQTIALKAQASAMNLNPWVIATVAIIACTAALVTIISTTQNATKLQEKLAETTEKLKNLTSEYAENNKKLTSNTETLNAEEKKTLETRQALLKNQIVATLKTQIDTISKLETVEKKQQETLNKTNRRYEEISGVVKKYNRALQDEIQSGKANSETAEYYRRELKSVNSNLADITTTQAKNTVEVNKSTLAKEEALVALTDLVQEGLLDISQIRLYNIEIAKEVANRVTNTKEIKKQTEGKKEEIKINEISIEAQKKQQQEATENFKAAQMAQADAYKYGWIKEQQRSQAVALTTEAAVIADLNEIQNDGWAYRTQKAFEAQAAINRGNEEVAEKERLLLEGKKALFKTTYDKISGYVSQISGGIFDVVNQMLDNESTALDNKLGKEKEIYDEEEKIKLDQLATTYEANKSALENQGLDEETLKAKLKALEDQYTIDKNAAETARTEFEAKQKAERDALKKKEFVANQIASATQATISTANAVMNVLSTPGLPPWISIPLSVTMGALGAMQVSAILSQPIPEYAMGGNFGADTPMIVGERGPELAVFNQPGKIFSNQESKRMMGGTNNFYINQDIDMDLAMLKLGRQGYKTARGKI